MRTDVVGLTHR